MGRSFRDWLNDLPLQDTVQRRQAGSLQAMLLVVFGGCVIGLPAGLLTATRSGGVTISFLSYPIIMLCMLGALALLRRGHFDAAVLLSVSGIELALGAAVLAIGLEDSGRTFFAFSVPIAQAGLLMGRRGLAYAGLTSVGLIALIGALSSVAPQMVGFAPATSMSLTSILGDFVLVGGVLILVIDRYSSSLRDALAQAIDRQQELQTIRSGLETAVTERTSSLRAALASVEEREARLVAALDDLRASQATVRDLSAPVLPVLPGVLVAPLVGALDAERAANLATNVLAAIEAERATHIVLDITGVPVVDTHVAQTLLQVAQAARLLGARPVLVGIRPEVAQTMVTLGIDVGTLATYSNLQEALGALLARRSLA